MKLREWCAQYPKGEMTGLRLTGPTGTPWTLAHAWRMGEVDPEKPKDEIEVGMFLYEGNETSGDCKTVFTTWGSWMDNWKVRP